MFDKFKNLLVAVFIFATCGNAGAENWMRPLSGSPFDYWWLDMDSVRRDSAGYVYFDVFAGSNPSDPMLGTSMFPPGHQAMHCASSTRYARNQSGAYERIDRKTNYDFELDQALVRLLCR